MKSVRSYARIGSGLVVAGIVLVVVVSLVRGVSAPTPANAAPSTAPATARTVAFATISTVAVPTEIADAVTVVAAPPSSVWSACGAWSICSAAAEVTQRAGDVFARFDGVLGAYGVLRSCTVGARCELTNNSLNNRWCLSTNGVPYRKPGRGQCPEGNLS